MEFVLLIGLIAAVFLFHVALWSALLVAVAYFTLGWFWALHHFWQVIGYAAAYLVVGAVWSVIKWWFAETNEVREARDNYVRRRLNDKESMEAYLLRYKTTVKSHKEDIIFWISFWPLNALWTLLDDPIRRAARRIWSELQGVYQRITDHVWKA